MSHRRGASLVEVLVAIFITAIGLLSLLVLFPLGALSMAQAVRDDRTSHMAANATANARMASFHTDENVVTGMTWATLLPSGGNIWVGPAPDDPSFPAMLDPIGMRIVGTPPGPTGSLGQSLMPGRIGAKVFSTTPLPPSGGLVPNQLIRDTPGLPRVNASFLAPPSATFHTSLRWFTLLDDLTFNENGGAKTIGTEIEREGRYSCAYLFKRSVTRDPSSTDMKVIVYQKRSLQVSGLSLQPIGEYVYRAEMFPFDPVAPNAPSLSPHNAVRLRWDATTEEPPPVRRGSWILDITMPHQINAAFLRPVVPPPGTSGPTTPSFHGGAMMGGMYRVVGLTPVNNTTMDLELERNLQGYQPLPGATASAQSRAQPGVVVVLDNVVEVFDKTVN